MQKYKRDKCMLACNLDVLHFYRAKARERGPEGGELAWRMLTARDTVSADADM